MNAGLDALTGPHLWRGRAGCAARLVRATGFDALDDAFGGGWPWGAIVEIFVERYGSGELGVLMPALAAAIRDTESGLLVFVSPPFVPYPPALARHAVDVGRTLVVKPGASAERSPKAEDAALWATEHAVRSGACAAVLSWLPSADGIALRRLQLATEERRCGLVLFRSLRRLRMRSPAALRIKVSAEGPRTRVEVLKCRGGRPGAVVLDALGPSCLAKSSGEASPAH